MSYTSRTSVFEPVSAQAKRTGRCRVCGHKTTRSLTFVQTVSPYNLVLDRSRPKTRTEVAAAVQAEADAWSPGPAVFDHEACRTGQS